ncbi:MAG: hypothetical protein PHQ52_02640 [Candidatus Omnitrophica bacterium]|nr:hypothetical protein [Candidatus Omnitrophota bacterium]
MKKYIKPKTKAVELLTEQAVLEVCQIGGGWFGDSSTHFCEPYHSTGTVPCTYSVRGVVQGYNHFEASPGQSQPS